MEIRFFDDKLESDNSGCLKDKIQEFAVYSKSFADSCLDNTDHLKWSVVVVANDTIMTSIDENMPMQEINNLEFFLQLAGG